MPSSRTLERPEGCATTGLRGRPCRCNHPHESCKTGHALNLVRRGRRLRRSADPARSARRGCQPTICHPSWSKAGTSAAKCLQCRRLQLSVDLPCRDDGRAVRRRARALIRHPRLQRRYRVGAHDDDAPVQSAVRATSEAARTRSWSPTCACANTRRTVSGVLSIVRWPMILVEQPSGPRLARRGGARYRGAVGHDGRTGRGAAAALTIAASECNRSTPRNTSSSTVCPMRQTCTDVRGSRTHQMDPPMSKRRWEGKDIEEGADIVMVKPAMPYLDGSARQGGAFGRRGVSGERRVFDDQGRRRARLAR
jgi:hypothetical protein